MKLPRLTLARILRCFGTLLLSASALAFLGWVQGLDPECMFGEAQLGPMLQLRMCESYIEAVQPAPWWRLAGIAGAALLGWMCMRFTRRRVAALWRRLSGSGSPGSRGPC